MRIYYTISREMEPIGKERIKRKRSFNAHVGDTRGKINNLVLQGIPVKPLYTEKDIEHLPKELPGVFPYTRGNITS